MARRADGGRAWPAGQDRSGRGGMNGSRDLPENSIDRGVKLLVVTIPRLLLGTLILAGIAINFANVMGRYLFLSPIIWAEEILIYVMVWTVFVGAVLVTWEGRHLRMDFFSIMLPSPYKQIMASLSTICFILVCVFVIPQAYTVFGLMMRLDQRSVVAEIPMSIPHFAIVLGFALMLVAVVFRIRSSMSGRLGSEPPPEVVAAQKQA
jgi:TRAP-type C4-dicarboxylate transport system permease small subunit